MEVYKLLQELELELVQQATRRNSRRLAELIDDGYEELGSSGKHYRKQDILNSRTNENKVHYELSDFEFKTLSKDCILVKYKSIFNGTVALRSSIWINNCRNWQMLHHQATVVKNAF